VEESADGADRGVHAVLEATLSDIAAITAAIARAVFKP
jgi:hypothetical protein